MAARTEPPGARTGAAGDAAAAGAARGPDAPAPARQGRGCGKVILVGEHAVVYGVPALAGALRAGAVAALGPGQGRLCVPAWRAEVRPDRDGEPLARAFAALRSAAGLPERDEVDVTLRLEIPAGAGLGGSAAAGVAIARALLGAAGPPDERLVARAVAAFEEVVHGRASGVDACLAQRGGIGVFERGQPFRPLSVPPLRLAIGLTGERRSTAEAVAAVGRLRASRPIAVRERMASLGELACEAAAHLVSGDARALGRCLDLAHGHLAALGVSSSGLEALCRIAREAGAYGAKLTGAGRGGAAIALLPGGEAQVVEAWRRAGFDGFVGEVG